MDTVWSAPKLDEAFPCESTSPDMHSTGRGHAWRYFVVLVISCLALGGCSEGPGDLDSRNRVTFNTPLPGDDVETRISNSLTSYVWVTEGKFLAVWFSREGKLWRAHVVDQEGSVEAHSLMSLKRYAELIQQREVSDGSAMAEEIGGQLKRDRWARFSLERAGFPIVPFRLLRVGDDYVAESKYGNLVVAEYIQTSPGADAITYLSDANYEQWMKLAAEQTHWDWIKYRVGLRDLWIYPNLPARTGYDNYLATALVHFDGGGRSLLQTIQEHGASLFEGPRPSSYVERKSPTRFLRTALVVPEGPMDSKRIAEIVSYLKRPHPTVDGQAIAPSEQAAQPRGDTESIATEEPAPVIPQASKAVTIAAVNFTNPNQNWNLQLNADPTIRCRFSERHEVPQNESATMLLSVAMARRIAVYVHGLNFFAGEGTPNIEELERDWKDHIAILKNADTSWAYCIYAWDTKAGIPSDQSPLAILLFALQTLSGHATVFDEQRSISLVGHSAGGIYAKAAYYQMTQIRFSGSVDHPLKWEQVTPVYVATLGTPHEGAEFASDARSLARYFPMILRLSNVKLNHDDEEVLRKHVMEKAGYLAVIQLRPAVSNPWLNRLNEVFWKAFPEPNRFISIAGENDSIVRPHEADPKMGNKVVLPRYDHDRLLHDPGPDLARLMRSVYWGKLL